MGISILAASALATAGTVYSGQQQAKAQKTAANEAKDANAKIAQEQEQAMNKANAKRPNLSNILGNNEAAGQAGVGGTMLTGPGGVGNNTLSLAKNTLLGGG